MQPDQLEQTRTSVEAASPLLMGTIGALGLCIGLLMIVSGWKVFTKAGGPGWAVIVPIYNLIVFMKISGKPAWWFILLFIPLVGLIISIIACIGLAERFGKTAGYGIGLALLGFIFLPILAFGDAQYIGPKAA